MISLNDLANKIFSEKRVALIIHIRPDGDTIGSALALSKALRESGASVDIYCSDQVSERFFFLKGANEIKTKLVYNDYPLVVALDCADLSRLGEFGTFFEKHKNTISIDHHISNTYFAKVNYVMEKASNSENIFDLLMARGVDFNSEIANALATGVLTDTGNFRHKNVTENTFITASKLLGFGADFNYISFKMFTEQSMERAKLFGFVMSNIRYFIDGKFAVATVSAELIAKANAKQEDTEGFIDFVMGIKGVEIGACVMEVGEKVYKISLRSKKSDVNAVAGVFGGGGHILASGCKIYGEYEEVIDKLYSAVNRFIEV